MTTPTAPINAPAGEPADQGTLEWEILLDRLEVEILWVERLIAASEPLEEGGWRTPTPKTPLPPHLAARAHEIHARQLAMMGKLIGAMRRSAQEQAYAESAALNGDPDRPRYVDVAS